MIDKIWEQLKEKIMNKESDIYNKFISDKINTGDEQIIRNKIEYIYYNFKYYIEKYNIHGVNRGFSMMDGTGQTYCISEAGGRVGRTYEQLIYEFNKVLEIIEKESYD